MLEVGSLLISERQCLIWEGTEGRIPTSFLIFFLAYPFYSSILIILYIIIILMHNTRYIYYSANLGEDEKTQSTISNRNFLYNTLLYYIRILLVQ